MSEEPLRLTDATTEELLETAREYRQFSFAVANGW